MNNSEFRNPESALFLGVDGGQSHTEAVVADGAGNILAGGAVGALLSAYRQAGIEITAQLLANLETTQIK
jgi:N-acetylglucosamine kinase-like BadF-type ATPase